MVGTRDVHSGTCSTEGNAGSEAVVVFTAPRAEEWEFRTLDGENTFDTLMYARGRCDGPELDCGSDPEGAACCNDDIQLGRIYQSRLRIQMQAGQTIYLFIDHYEGTNDDEFTLQAKPYIPTQPPSLTNAKLVIDEEEKTVGFIFYV